MAPRRAARPRRRRRRPPPPPPRPGATAGQIRKAAVRGGAARKRGVDLNEGDRLVGGRDPLANPIPSRRFSARLLAKKRLAVFVERPEVAADYIVTEKKDGRESSSLRRDSPDEKGNSMIDSRKKTGAPTLASALTAQNKVEFSYSSLIVISSSVFFLLNSVF
nr:PREDICTED: uncharacterized protein LOC103991132 [Musa acuminata subsp. malaccensis]